MNKIAASSATFLVGFLSSITTLTSTITWQRFFTSKHLAKFDLISEDEYRIELSDPYIIYPPLSMTKAFYQTLIVHRPNPSG